MSKRSRRNHTPVFKSKVTLAALKDDKTVAELSQQFYFHLNQISQWKTQLMERVGVMFAGSGCTESSPVEIEAPHAKIGELILGNEFFENCAQQRRPAKRKTIIDQARRLPITRQVEALGIVEQKLGENF